MPKIHALDAVGLILAFTTVGFLIRMLMGDDLRSALDGDVSHRLERRALVTGALAGITTVIAVITNDAVRVALFAFMAGVVLFGGFMLRRRRLTNAV